MAEQQTLFNTADDAPARPDPAARAAELRHLLDYHA